MTPTSTQSAQIDNLFHSFRSLPPGTMKSALFDLATDCLRPKDLHELANMIDRAADAMERDAL